MKNKENNKGFIFLSKRLATNNYNKDKSFHKNVSQGKRFKSTNYTNYLHSIKVTFDLIFYFLKIFRLHNVSIHTNFHQNLS